jgi:CHAT domain-containing protein/Tfp pilus assembly protein PilF
MAALKLERARADGRRRRAVAIAWALVVAGACGGTLLAAPAAAQPYARFAVPDSALAGAVRASGAQFETVWNALLVAELRASLARADSAARLSSLARRVAGAETPALGSRIGADALALRAHWAPAQRRARIAAAVAESIATAARADREYARADSLFDVALRTYQGLGEKRRVATLWLVLSGVAMNRGDMPAADSLGRRALVARRALGDARLVGNAVNQLGSVAYTLRRYDDAWGYFQEARAVREQTGERAALGTTLNNLGLVAAAQGRADSAGVYYRQALELTVQQGDSARAQEVLNNYGFLLRDGADPGAALPLFERSLAIRRQRGLPAPQAEVLLNIGNLLRQQGHFTEARQRLEASRDLALTAGDVTLLRKALTNLGWVWIGLGDASAARAPLERALALADSLGDFRGQAETLNNLSVVARLEDDVRGGERLANRALAAGMAAGDSAVVRDAVNTLGTLASDRGDLAAAHVWFTRANAAGAQTVSQQAADLQNLGSVLARANRLDEAERFFRDGLALAERSHAPDFAWPALLGLGDVAERRGADATALAFDRRAATMIEDLRAEQGSERPSVALLGQRLFAFEALIHLLTRLQPRYPDSAYAAEAFHWSERARARAFLDLVAASARDARRVAPLTLAQAQALLPTNKDALLAYSVGDSSTSLWVLTRRAWKHVALPPRKALRVRTEALRRGLADPAIANTRATHRAERALYQALIEPALPMLDGVEHLVVAPDGALALVPFEALLTTDVEGDGPPPRGAYLVERYAVSYTASASALATRIGATHASGIVALGDPAFGTDSSHTVVGAAPGLPRLPNTAAEIAALRSLAGRRPIVVLTGRDATRERLLALPGLAGASLVHVATHGVANEVEPERSGLWMATAPGATGPGFLSLPDILALRLDAGLVTLSACETGLGRLERGEGVVGLTRAFMAAGARSVMVSLWKVNDRSTSLLMERFYRGLLKDGAPATTALAQAKRALLKDPETRSPFYWAPFVLVGNAGRLGG